MDISSFYQKQNLNDQYDIVINNPSYEESLQSQDIYFPSQKVLITLLIIFFFCVLLLEKLFISLFLLIIPSYILLLLTMILLHIYFLRCIVYLCAFPGKNYFVQFYLRYIRSKTIGQILRNKLKVVLDCLNKLIKLAKDNSELNKKKLEEVCTGFPKNLDIINDHNEIYKTLYEKYPTHFNEYSTKFYNVLSNFKDKYDNGIIKDIATLINDSQRKITLNETAVPQLNETKTLAEKLLQILDEFLFENKFEFNKIYTYIKQFIRNDLFRTNEYNRIKTILHLNYEELTIVSHDNTKLDCLLIKPNEDMNMNMNTHNKNLIIICGPNLTGMEHLFRSWDLDELYLAQNCDILFWNYRGYGWSEGSATFSNVKRDIEAIYDYIKSHKTYTKIGVHGLSVGGVAACHLSTVRHVDLLVGDRTFGSVYGMVNAIKGGKYLMYLAKVLCIENADNAGNFIEAKCLKIVMNDPEDNTVFDKISLKTEIAKKLITKIFGSNIEYMTNVEHQSENVLHYIFTVEQRRTLYDDMFYLFDFLQTSETGVTQVLLDKKGKKYNTTSVNKEQCDDKIIKLTSPENIGEISMKKVVDIFYYNIKSSFECIKSCGETLYDIRVDTSAGIRRLHLNNFINNLFIFGVNDDDKKDIMICSYEHNERIFSNAIHNLEQVINNADVKQYHEFVLYDKVSKCVDHLKKMKYFISEHKDEVCNDMIDNQKGILVPLYSGHIAFYDSMELDTIKYWVNNGFFV